MRYNSERARYAIMLLWVMFGMEMLVGISSFMQLTLLQQMADGYNIDEDTLTMNDMREMVLNLLYLVGHITCAVVYIRWFRRAYYNLHQLPINVNHDEGWAAGAWFVPILNLFRPYQIMSELYRETRKILRPKDAQYKYVSAESTVGWWWGLWVVWSVMGNFEARISFRADSIDDYILSDTISVFSAFIGMPLALLAIKVVKDYSVLENKMYDRRDELFGDDDREIELDLDSDILDAMK